MSFKNVLALAAAASDLFALVADWVKEVYKLSPEARIEYLLAFKDRAVAFLDTEFDKGGFTPPVRRMKPERTQLGTSKK